jgi:tyrosyl-tRNA synthetase
MTHYPPVQFVISMSRSLPRRWLFDSPCICRSCRTQVQQRAGSHNQGQQRWIGYNHINNIKIAQQEWESRAADIVAGKSKSILDVLEERGYVNQIVGKRDDLNRLLIHRRVGVYSGFDPTAPSLHVGHMVPLMVLGWFYIHGYSANYLLGGSTAKFGDPTDRLTARAKVKASTQKANMASMHIQLKRLGVLVEKYADRKGYKREWAWRRALLNNNAWWNSATFTEVMRIMGSRVRIGPMLGRDTVKNRMEKGDGMSFSEFAYPLMQAWDWWHLYQNGVQVQIGGADQFGNILAGAEAVKLAAKTDEGRHELSSGMRRTKRVHAEVPDDEGLPSTPYEQSHNVPNDPLGFTVPLLTTAAGEKFGKSAGNAVWLDPDLTSSFDLYQFFLRSADADVERYLKLFTFLPLSEISSIMDEQHKDESKRVAQHTLAREFVELVHGLTAAEEAEKQHRSAFKKDLSLKEIQDATAAAKTPQDSQQSGILPINPILNRYAPQTNAENAQATHLTLPSSLVRGQPLAKILWTAGLVVSRSEGQRLINANGVHIGAKKGRDQEMDDSLSYRRVGDADLPMGNIVDQYIINDELLILRAGKWKHRFITIVPDAEYEKLGLTCPGWKDERGENAGRGVTFQEEMVAWKGVLADKRESKPRRLAWEDRDHFPAGN